MDLNNYFFKIIFFCAESQVLVEEQAEVEDQVEEQA